MFNFKKQTLDPLVIAVAKKIEEALKTTEETERAGKLLDVKKESLELFDKVIAREDKKYLIGLGVLVAVFVTGLTGGGALGLALPLATGALLYTGGLGLLWSAIGHNANTRRAQNTVKQKINTEVFKLIEAKPQEMLKSPRIQKELKDQFNPAAAEDKSYETLVAGTAWITPRKLIYTDERLQKLVSETRKRGTRPLR